VCTNGGYYITFGRHKGVAVAVKRGKQVGGHEAAGAYHKAKKKKKEKKKGRRRRTKTSQFSYN